ncbi:hypothetical protein RMATCC62417_06150 [Rhizopus microsporus]|nr:hypothetical protein RMATCC62417_06150 [Rhizopus microsporus]
MNYTNDYENVPENVTLSTRSNDYHPYQLFTDNTRSEFTPMIFHSAPTNETNNDMELMQHAHDYNLDIVPPLFPSSPCKNTQSQRGIAGFVSKLYQCLQAPESDQKYARWCKHQGRDMFIIECIPEFTETVLPRLFKHCKFPSFVRQLNIYGFQRDTDARKSKDSKDRESCRWYHPYFRPGRRDLFHLIRRKATRYTRRKRAKQEEDPETILNIEGDDESAFEEDAQTVKSNNNNNRRSSSSASSVRLPEYYLPPSQLQLTCEPPAANTSSALVHIPLMEQPIEQQEPATEAVDDKEADTHSHPDEPNIESITEQELRLQLYHVKRQCQQMHGYYDEQLNAARLKIQEQQLRIQQLESALSIIEQHTVKPNVVQRPSGGYINTMCTTSLQPNCYTQPPPSMYEIPKLSQPFYFHSNNHHSDTNTNSCMMQPSYVKVKKE